MVTRLNNCCCIHNSALILQSCLPLEILQFPDSHLLFSQLTYNFEKIIRFLLNYFCIEKKRIFSCCLSNLLMLNSTNIVLRQKDDKDTGITSLKMIIYFLRHIVASIPFNEYLMKRMRPKLYDVRTLTVST